MDNGKERDKIYTLKNYSIGYRKGNNTNSILQKKNFNFPEKNSKTGTNVLF